MNLQSKTLKQKNLLDELTDNDDDNGVDGVEPSEKEEILVTKIL